MSEPWNTDRKKTNSKADAHVKVIVVAALCWSGVMLAAGEVIKCAKSGVKRMKTRYNRTVGRED